jgi:Toxin PAAR-like domain/GHH signature containing HNH/Endo VII superfamily nuclease toxin  2
MSNQVFANMMEVSCKAAMGKAICAFPDVCFTPPMTPVTPPGVPVPYPNTGMASDCTSGSTSVQVSGQEVMLKDKSYFKRSSGDEAGAAPKKGVITSMNMGKVYFAMWSMDVKIEGENVVRHFDLTTHNHASTPPNAPPWLYTDTMGMSVGGTSDPCQSTRAEAESKCKKHMDNNTYKGGARNGQVNQTGAKRDMCDDDDCKEAMKCVLTPFSFGCCDDKPKKTPHHVVPVHCFMPPGQRELEAKDPTTPKERYKGCENYDADDAPCVCAHGKGKKPTRKQHGRLHKHFDPIEDSHKVENGGDGTWSLDDASSAGTGSVKKVFPACDEKCTRAQLDKYHSKDAKIPPSTKLRADSSGQAKPAASLQVVIPTGALGPP